MKTKQSTPRNVIPPDVHHLYTHGSLSPADAEALGVKAMGCSECHTPVTLVTTFAPIPESEQANRVLPLLCGGKTFSSCARAAHSNNLTKERAPNFHG
jgi:hypothetical protein